MTFQYLIFSYNREKSDFEELPFANINGTTPEDAVKRALDVHKARVIPLKDVMNTSIVEVPTFKHELKVEYKLVRIS